MPKKTSRVFMLKILGVLFLGISLTATARLIAHRMNTPFTKILLTSWLASPSTSHEKPLLKFGVVSDIHIKPSDKQAQTKFSAMLSDMSTNLQAKALIIVGDLGNGTPRDYTTVREIVNVLPTHPSLYFTIGNHEFYQAYQNPKTNIWSPLTFPNGETDQKALHRFLNFIGEPKVYYDQYILGYHFIFLGSEASAMTSKQYLNRAFLSKQQLTWLQDKLTKDHLKNKPTFVFLHQPLPGTTSGSTNHSNISDIVQARELENILRQHPEVILFTGHTHSQLGLANTFYHNIFTMVNDSSVSLPKSGKGKSLPKLSEGLFVEVYRNRVVIRGRDFTSSQWIANSQYVVNEY